MENFNEYMNEVDFSEIRKLCLEKGKLVEIKKKDYFVRQGERSKCAGFIESGMLELSDAIHRVMSIVGYAFNNEYAGSYI